MVESRLPSADLLERFHRWLRERRLPVTRQRDLVATTVFASAELMPVTAIHRRLREGGAEIGIATIYRSLEILVESGLVRAHNFGDGFTRYEALTSAGPRGHLICTRCGRVSDFPTERLERLLLIAADEHGFQHQRHRIDIQGLCSTCRDADLDAMVHVRRSR